jgi:lipoprotein-releasing system permease protein
MRFELFVAWRYLVARRREKFISLVGAISVLGVAVGVAALIVVLSVMAGFDNDLKEKIIGINPHVLIENAGGMSELDPVIDKLKATEGVVAVSPYINGQVILKTPRATIGAVCKGIDSESESGITRIKEFVVKGSLPRAPGQVVLGRELAAMLGVEPSDFIGVISGVDGREYRFSVSGTFACGMYDVDAGLVFMGIEDAQRVFVMPAAISGVGIRLKDAYAADRFAQRLRMDLNYMYAARSWTEMNSNLFSALKLEKVTMFVILTLIVIVACFNISATLIMMVLEKTQDIGILKAIGATNRTVRIIFTLQGFIIGFIGTGLGMATGVGLCGLLERYKFIQLPKEIYYIDRLPVRIQWSDSALIILAAILISLLATVYPAWQASRLEPVSALRYE